MNADFMSEISKMKNLTVFDSFIKSESVLNGSNTALCSLIDNIYSDDHLADCMEKIGKFEAYYREGVETGTGICYSYEKEEMLITLLFDDSSIDFSQFDMKIDQEKVRNDNPRLTHILICNNSDYIENYNLDLYRKEPFYALVCQSAKSSSVTENSIEMLIDYGFDAHLILTTDWSNLNQEPWYIVTAGYYNTQEEAQDNLLSVQKLFPDAYIKYSGSWKGNEKTIDVKQQSESLSSPINAYDDFSWSLSGNIINGGHAVFDGKDFNLCGCTFQIDWCPCMKNFSCYLNLSYQVFQPLLCQNSVNTRLKQE